MRAGGSDDEARWWGAGSTGGNGDIGGARSGSSPDPDPGRGERQRGIGGVGGFVRSWEGGGARRGARGEMGRVLGFGAPRGL